MGVESLIFKFLLSCHVQCQHLLKLAYWVYWFSVSHGALSGDFLLAPVCPRVNLLYWTGPETDKGIAKGKSFTQTGVFELGMRDQTCRSFVTAVASTLHIKPVNIRNCINPKTSNLCKPENWLKKYILSGIFDNIYGSTIWWYRLITDWWWYRLITDWWWYRLITDWWWYRLITDWWWYRLITDWWNDTD